MNRITHSLAALLLIAGLAGCSEEETLSGTPGDTRTPITITVTDGGYTPDDAARQSTAGSDIRQNADNRPSTRAVDNGYATTFTAGDQIGLYIVKSDGTYAAENIPLTLTDMGDGTSAWQAPTGTTLYYEGAAAKYFAYYPYQQTLPAVSNTPDAPGAPDAPAAPAEPVKPNASATDASGFFAPLISAWTPATDQGTHAAYTAQDLMTGSGTASKQSGGTYSLSLTMTHAMALVVIETPMTKYTLTDKDGKSLPDYYFPAPDTRFYGFTPYNPSPGTYRYLVKPGQSGAADLMGSYTATGSDGSSSVTKEYAVSPNGITAANYALYKVDGGATTVISKSHTLKVGDFYMNDGSLLAGSTATLTAAQKAACLGIVYWVGNPTNSTDGDPLLAKDKSNCTHGLVVALHEAKLPSASAAAEMNWSASTAKVNSWTNSDDRGANKVNITVADKYQGYANTVALKAYNAQQSDANYKVLPIAAIEQYSKDYPAPSNSSDWYVPSIMELKYMCWGQGAASQSTAGRELLDTQLSKAGGTAFDSWNCWSSSEYAGSSSVGAWYVNFGNGDVGVGGKNNGEFRVRALFAF